MRLASKKAPKWLPWWKGLLIWLGRRYRAYQETARLKEISAGGSSNLSLRPANALRLAQPLPVGPQDPSETKGRTWARTCKVLEALFEVQNLWTKSTKSGAARSTVEELLTKVPTNEEGEGVQSEMRDVEASALLWVATWL